MADFPSAKPGGGSSGGMPVAPTSTLHQAQGSNWVSIEETGTTLYRWETDTTASDPGLGKMKGNNSDLSLITEIYISSKSLNGADFTDFFNKLSAGNAFYTANAASASNFSLGGITDEPTDNGGWFTIKIMPTSTAGTYQLNNDINVTIQAFLTDAEVKSKYEANNDTNAFTDSDKEKVDFVTVTAAANLDDMQTAIGANAVNIISHESNIGNPHGTNSDNTPNNSTVTGATVTEALDDLNKPIVSDVIILGISTATSQEPTATDTPLQIEFGPAQVTSEVSLSASGAITINEDGQYMFDALVHFGRTTGPGELKCFFEILINGSPTVASVYVKVDNPKIVIPISDLSRFNLVAGDVVTYEIIRDSTGANNGGLLQFTPTLAGRPAAPTAAINISKLTR